MNFRKYFKLVLLVMCVQNLEEIFGIACRQYPSHIMRWVRRKRYEMRKNERGGNSGHSGFLAFS